MFYSKKIPVVTTVQTVPQSSLSKITSTRILDVLTGLRSSSFQNQTVSISFQVFSNRQSTVLSSALSSVLSVSQVLFHHLSSFVQFFSTLVLYWQTGKVIYNIIVIIVTFSLNYGLLKAQLAEVVTYVLTFQGNLVFFCLTYQNCSYC